MGFHDPATPNSCGSGSGSINEGTSAGSMTLDILLKRGFPPPRPRGAERGSSLGLSAYFFPQSWQNRADAFFLGAEQYQHGSPVLFCPPPRLPLPVLDRGVIRVRVLTSTKCAGNSPSAPPSLPRHHSGCDVSTSVITLPASNASSSGSPPSNIYTAVAVSPAVWGRSQSARTHQLSTHQSSAHESSTHSPIPTNSTTHTPTTLPPTYPNPHTHTHTHPHPPTHHAHTHTTPTHTTIKRTRHAWNEETVPRIPPFPSQSQIH